LDKLIRSIVNFFQYLTQKPIRSVFEKSIEAVQVLSYETKEEVMEYVQEVNESKKLSKTEVYALIKRRVDFNT
jgi:hypothetical protein